MNSQSMAITPELVRLAEDLMVAIAFEELIRPTVVAYENEILARLQLPVDPKFRESTSMTTIVDRNYAYMLSEHDFQVFFTECQAARIQNGLKVEQPDQCPLSIATGNRLAAEDAFLVEAFKLPEIQGKFKVETLTAEAKAELIGLLLNQVAPFLRSSSEILKEISGDV